MRIAVFGNFGVHNLGDDLILEGFLKEAQQKGHEVIVFSGAPEQVKRQFSVPSRSFFPGGVRSLLSSWFIPSVRKQMKSSKTALDSVDLVVVGGGGILVDHHLKALSLWYAQLRRIRKAQKPLHFRSNSLELRTPLSRRIFAPFLRSAQEITVRDRASQQLLAELNLHSTVVPDLALSAHLPGPDHPKTASKKSPPTVALALCQWGLGLSQKAALQSFCAQLTSTGYRIIPLAFQTHGDDDRLVYQDLGLDLPVLTKRDDILQTIQSCSALIGMRFHAVLLALHFKRPVLAIPYQQKVEALMKERGFSNQLIAISDLNLKNLQAHFEKVIDEA